MELNIFTLNCWSIPYISKDRNKRINAIAQYLLKSSHTIICLQEIWSEKDYIFLRDTLKSVLPYSHYFYSGVLGSGLCVFSKWLIQDVFFHQWPLNGYIHKIHHGDWFGGKGIGLCRIRCRETLINVYCTHLHAEYHEKDMYLAHRVLQAYSTAEFVNLTAEPADICILAGDLNTEPGDLSYRLVTSVPSLVDPFDLPCDQSNPDIKEASGTSENANNSYSNPKEIKKLPDGKRIDHILFRTNSKIQVKVLNFGNPLKDRVPEENFSYSDHNAVCLEIQLSEGKDATDCSQEKENNFNITLENISEAIQICEQYRSDVVRSKKLFLVTASILFMLLLGTVGLWPHTILHDLTRIIITVITLYFFIMGTLWNRIEINSLKGGLSALKNFSNMLSEIESCDKKDMRL